MNKIVEELQAWTPWVAGGYEVPAAAKTMCKAALEIELLEEQLAQSREQAANLFKGFKEGAELRGKLDHLLGESGRSLTPNVRDLAFTIWNYTRFGKNPDDGGPVDWFNDTLPIVEEFIKENT